jgi:hypothetical protein
VEVTQVGKSNRFVKGLASALVVALCATTIAVAGATSVTPRIIVPKHVVTYGESSPFTVKAVGGSFEGTITVYKSVESSVAGFAAILSTRTVRAAKGVNPGKLNQNTWFYASYVPSGSVVPTTSKVAMIGVKAKLGQVGYNSRKHADRDMLRVSGSLEVTPAAKTARVELQKLVRKSTEKAVRGKKVAFWKWEWNTIESKEATLTKSAKKDAYTFQTDFGTMANYKGTTLRAVVSYEDVVHLKAIRYGHWLAIRK